jgi:hypothetical protein
MLRSRGLGRLGLLAVGLGIGAAVASTPGVACAEGSAVDTAWDNFLQGIANSFAPEVNEHVFGDPDAFCFPALLSCAEAPGDQMFDAFYQTVNTAFQPEGPIDNFFDQLFPAQTSALDMQVSIDNIDLFPTAGNTATAVSGPLDIAIAIGNASAQAGQTGGLLTIFDFAFADGASSDANALGGSFDSAIANGANSFANAAPGSFDSAIADGANSTADAGGTLGSGLGSFDLAAAFGDMLHAIATGNFMTDIVP